MNPLPTQETGKSIPALPLSSSPGSYSNSNRRATACPIQRVYPWLLFASTAVAATFCLAYITKPVILPAPDPRVGISLLKKEVASNAAPLADATGKIIPDERALPGETADDTASAPANPALSSPLATDFEETNIRIQHVLDAESPSGDVSRIVIDVPVLYQSRNLRWTQAQAEEARGLLDKLALYQENVRALRTQGIALRNEWNSLMAESIPAEALRADSPSLPANQQDMLSPKAPSETTETIKLRNNPAK